MPEGESAWPGVLLITLALCCDALVANLEEAWFFRAPQPSSQAEVAMGLSAISAAYALLITVITGAVHHCLSADQVWQACVGTALGTSQAHHNSSACSPAARWWDVPGLC